MSISVQEQVEEEVRIARRAYQDGERAGLIKGHRAGFDQGYTTGFADGIRSSTSYKQGCIDGWRDGFIDAQADQDIKQREAA